jgi:hypothetical protein
MMHMKAEGKLVAKTSTTADFEHLEAGFHHGDHGAGLTYPGRTVDVRR